MYHNTKAKLTNKTAYGCNKVVLSIVHVGGVFPVSEGGRAVATRPKTLLVSVRTTTTTKKLFCPPSPNRGATSVNNGIVAGTNNVGTMQCKLAESFIHYVRTIVPSNSVVGFSSGIIGGAAKCSMGSLIVNSRKALYVLARMALGLLPTPAYAYALMVPFEDLRRYTSVIPGILRLPFIPATVRFLRERLVSVMRHGLGGVFPMGRKRTILVIVCSTSDGRRLSDTIRTTTRTTLTGKTLSYYVTKAPRHTKTM